MEQVWQRAPEKSKLNLPQGEDPTSETETGKVELLHTWSPEGHLIYLLSLIYLLVYTNSLQALSGRLHLCPKLPLKVCICFKIIYYNQINYVLLLRMKNQDCTSLQIFFWYFAPTSNFKKEKWKLAQDGLACTFWYLNIIYFEYLSFENIWWNIVHFDN